MADTLTTLADLVDEYVGGWSERIHHGVRDQHHTPACKARRRILRDGIPPKNDKDPGVPAAPGTLRHLVCRCPRYADVRTRAVHQPGLLAQLNATATLTRDGDGGEGGRTKPSSRPPGSLAATELLSTIRRDVATLTATLRAANGHTGPAAARRFPDELRGLVSLASTLPGDHPATADTIRTLRRHRKAARVQLGYDAPTKVLQDVVCGECGGTLMVPADAGGDVRCTGGFVVEGPAEMGRRWPVVATGCGAVWRRHEWIRLLDQQAAS